LSRDIENWERGPHNPVLLEGSPGAWDRALQVGCVVRAPDKRYALLYDGYDGKRWRGVGVAFSDSPLGPFEKYAGNPVLVNGGPEDFDYNHIHLHTCLRMDDGRYALLYTGFRAAPPTERSGDQGGLAFSKDLLTWKKYEGNPVFSFAPPGTFYDAHLRPKGILGRSGWYYLFFEGAHFDDLWFDQASLARSKDLIHWEKFPYPLPSLGTGQSYDSIVTEWPVPTVGPEGEIVLFYMCLPLAGYGKTPDPNKLSICMTKLPSATLEHWDEFRTPLTGGLPAGYSQSQPERLP
jgi:sucrose-6-phosphate hydrolase SacC (GH32 family)